MGSLEASLQLAHQETANTLPDDAVISQCRYDSCWTAGRVEPGRSRGMPCQKRWLECVSI